MRNKHKPKLIANFLVKEDTWALAHFFAKYPNVALKLEGNRVMFKAIGVAHYHELEIGPSGVKEVEA